MNSSNTIEPGLISLHNDAPSDSATSPLLDLPTLQDLNILKTSGRPLLPEPEARTRIRKPNPAESSRATLIPAIDDDESPYKADERKSFSSDVLIAKCAPGASSRQSLHKILDEDGNDPMLVKKRHIAEQNKDDFVQLPQPPKKQKTVKQVVPPIIIGLFEPPPQATLFPPIASSSFHDSHGRNSLNIDPLRDKVPKKTSIDEPENISGNSAAHSARVQKPKNVATRKKWTEEETNNLLLGVHKHGVGCWTDILSDSSFTFNGRSPADLKDRWRTCCPIELRKNVTPGIEVKNKLGAQLKPRSSLMSENILIHDVSISTSTSSDTNSGTKQKKRAHRKKLEDLAQLGIEGPIRQSNRRERRQFTEEEDRAIIEGYNIYGPAWSKIQKDPRLKLESRRPTDLRDRFRNKFPERFREDKGSKTPNSTRQAKSKEVVCPPEQDMVKRDNENPAKETPHTPLSQTYLPTLPSRDGLRIQEMISTESFSTLIDQPSIDTVENLHFVNFQYWGQGTTAPFSNIIGEMDISRLLLDGSWTDLPNSKDKQNHLESNNLLSASSDPFQQLPSFFNMPNEADDLNEEPFG